MIRQLLLSLAVSLILTLALELAFALVWGLRGRDLGLVALMNVMTNPAAVTLHFVMQRLPGWASPWWTVPLELLAVLAEGLCCRGRVRHPWRFALLINLFSYSMGLLIQFIWRNVI